MFKDVPEGIIMTAGFNVWAKTLEPPANIIYLKPEK